MDFFLNNLYFRKKFITVNILTSHIRNLSYVWCYHLTTQSPTLNGHFPKCSTWWKLHPGVHCLFMSANMMCYVNQSRFPVRRVGTPKYGKKFVLACFWTHIRHVSWLLYWMRLFSKHIFYIFAHLIPLYYLINLPMNTCLRSDLIHLMLLTQETFTYIDNTGLQKKFPNFFFSVFS